MFHWRISPLLFLTYIAFVPKSNGERHEQFSISTKFDGGIIAKGVMFDVKVRHETFIKGFEINAQSGTHQIEIYTKKGSFQGFEIDSVDFWKKVANVTVEGSGPFIPTIIPSESFENIWIEENETQALLITMDSENMILTRPRSMLASVGSSLVSNDSVELFRGVGVHEPFKFTLGYPVEWNGIIHYEFYNPTDIKNSEAALHLKCGDEVIGSTVNQSPISAPECGYDNNRKTSVGNGENGAMKYSFSSTTSTPVDINLCDENSDFDSKVRVFRESDDGDYECVNGNDDFCGSQASVSFHSELGENYIIVVDGNEDEEGDFIMNIVCPTPLEHVQTIAELSCGRSFFGTTYGLPAVSASSCGLNSTDHKKGSVKYSYKEDNNRLVTLSLCEKTDFDTQIRVYEQGVEGDLVCVTANDDFCDTQSSVTFRSLANTDYVVVVDGNNGAEGTYMLDVACPVPDVITHVRQTFVMVEPELAESEQKLFESTINSLSFEYMTRKFHGDVNTLADVVGQQSKKKNRRGDYEVTIDYLVSFSSQSVDVTGLPDKFIEHLSHPDNLRRFEEDLIFNGLVVVPGEASTPILYDPIEEFMQGLQESKHSNRNGLLLLIFGIIFFAVAIIICSYTQLRVWVRYSKVPKHSPREIEEVIEF